MRHGCDGARVLGWEVGVDGGWAGLFSLLCLGALVVVGADGMNDGWR